MAGVRPDDAGDGGHQECKTEAEPAPPRLGVVGRRRTRRESGIVVEVEMDRRPRWLGAAASAVMAGDVRNCGVVVGPLPTSHRLSVPWTTSDDQYAPGGQATRLRLVDTDRRRQLATSFGSVADVYERSRPGYPPDAVRWLVGDTPVQVLDLGAGTGKLTRFLRDAGHDVIAIDPSEPMLRRLMTALPGVPALLGTAEAIPVPDASVDVVAVAQAFHWFNYDVAMPEIARVLRPGGRLALVWNIRDASVSWVDELWTLINPEEPRRIELAEIGGDAVFGVGNLFSSVESVTFSHTQRLDRDGLLGLVTSRSYVAIKAPEERAPLLDAVSAIYDEHAGPDGIVLPYVTQCFRATPSK